VPTPKPTVAAPTNKPTQVPTEKPTTGAPTLHPTPPTLAPTANPTAPTGMPTNAPSQSPAETVTETPSQSPTAPVTGVPVVVPTNSSLVPPGYDITAATFSGGSPDSLVSASLAISYQLDNTTAFGTLTLDLSSSDIVSACGQVVQLDYAYGVLGGNWSVSRFDCTADGCSNTSSSVDACVYYQRISATFHQAGTLNLEIFPVNISEGPNPTQFGCPSQRPQTNNGLVMRDLVCESGNGLARNCITTPRAQCESQTNQYAVGVGMSVGGVGILALSLVSILAINKMVKA